MKKLIAVLLCAIVLSACSNGVSQEEYESVVAERDEYKATLESIAAIFSSDTDTDENIEQSNDESSPEKIKMIESGWSSYIAGDYAHVKYAVKIENPNSEYAVNYPTIIVTAKDSEGKILSTEERVLNSIAAGDSIYYGDEIFYEGSVPTTVDISVSNGNDDYSVQDDTEYVRQADFAISNVSEYKGDYNTTYTGEITNNSSVDFNTVAVILIYRQTGNIVGGDIVYVNDLTAGMTKAFELSADSKMTQYDSYEFYAIQW